MKKKLCLFLLIALPLVAKITITEARDNSYELNKLIAQGNTEAALVLIQTGVDFDSGGTGDSQYKRPLVWAATMDNFEVVRALMEAGDKVRLTLGRETALNMAVINLNYEMSEYLIYAWGKSFSSL